MLERVADCIKWPNSIQNMCYRCVNKGSDKKFDFWDKLKDALQGKESSWNFFYFFSISIVGIGACYTLITLVRSITPEHIKTAGLVAGATVLSPLAILFSLLPYLIVIFVILMIVLLSIAIAQGNI
jgi:hypothetical protein